MSVTPSKPSLNTIMSFIMLEKGDLFEILQGFANKALFPCLETKFLPRPGSRS